MKCVVTPGRLGLVVMIGFVVGYAGAGMLWPDPKRAGRIATLFEDICVTRAKGIPTDPMAFGLYKIKWPESSWLDVKSRSFLSLTNSGCEIRTAHPNALFERDAFELKRLVTALQVKHFPELSFDPKAQMGSVFSGWESAPTGTRGRWGLFLFAYPDWGENAGSALFIRFPSAQDA
ncbi:hypothetical protein [uncultured Pelagimonas sp.]|uniref:hypothetical protein n=1 Tax=uncultured Pelagimonas sp. TaxID=1618102 RepID=UPI00262E91F0|nr:hypothetical protein [uncultured Pelagimonas sp.]